MKNNKGLGMVFILIIIFAFLLTGGVIYYFNKNLNKPFVNPEDKNILLNDKDLIEEIPVQDVKIEKKEVVDNSKSDCLKTTKPSITIISPNGGEIFTTEQLINVKWKSCNIPEPAYFHLSIMQKNDESGKFGYSSIYSVLTGTPIVLNTGHTQLGPINNLGGFNFIPGNIYKISMEQCISDNFPYSCLKEGVSDTSDDLFTIQTKNQSGDNYDNFANCIKDSGAIFYGTFWCPHCDKQKDLFGESKALLPYTECSTPNGSGQLQVCIDKKIEGYPTWEFTDGSKLSGEVSLETLAQKTSCVLSNKILK